MTDISVSTTAYQVEDRSWLLSQWGQGPGENPSCVLDIATFTEATHYPNGYIPSGTPVGKVTATGRYGPYDGAAVDGRETFAGFVHSATKVPASGANPGAALVVAGMVKLSQLPIALDAAGQAEGRLFHFTA